MAQFTLVASCPTQPKSSTVRLITTCHLAARTARVKMRSLLRRQLQLPFLQLPGSLQAPPIAPLMAVRLVCASERRGRFCT